MSARAARRLPSCHHAQRRPTAPAHPQRSSLCDSPAALQRQRSSLRDSITTSCLHARELSARHQARARQGAARDERVTRRSRGQGRGGSAGRTPAPGSADRSSLRDSHSHGARRCATRRRALARTPVLAPAATREARARRSATRRRKLDVVVGNESLRQAPPARASGAGPTAQDGTAATAHDADVAIQNLRIS